MVELLLVASASNTVVGGGFPYFKVCNTFSQVGAALAEASPWWLCEDGAGETAVAAAAVAGGTLAPRRCSKSSMCRVRLICASQLFATDWGSSAWRMLDANARRGPAPVMDCGRPRCMSTPLHPELWNDLTARGACPLDSEAAVPLFSK